MVSRREEGLGEYVLGSMALSQAEDRHKALLLDLSAPQCSRLRSILHRCERAVSFFGNEGDGEKVAASVSVPATKMSTTSSLAKTTPGKRKATPSSRQSQSPVIDLTGDGSDEESTPSAHSVQVKSVGWDTVCAVDRPVEAFRLLLDVYREELDQKLSVTPRSIAKSDSSCIRSKYCLLTLLSVGAAVCLGGYLKQRRSGRITPSTTVKKKDEKIRKRPAFLLDLDAGEILSE